MVSQIKVNEIIKQSGSSITIGESGDTISIPTGATLSVSGSASGLPDNTPAFHIRKSSNQTGITSGGWTKITFDDEVYDTDSAFASDKFTAPSAGKYFFTASAKINDNGGDHDLVGSGMRLYVNGSVATSIVHFMNNNPSLAEGKTITGVLNLSANDYVEAYVYAQDGAGGTCSITGGNDRDTFFMGFKLTGG